MQTYMHASTQRAGVCVQPVQVAVRCGAFEGEAATGLEECFGAWGGENAVELGTFSWTSTKSAVEVGCRGHRKRQAGHEERTQRSTRERGCLIPRNTPGNRLAARGAKRSPSYRTQAVQPSGHALGRRRLRAPLCVTAECGRNLEKERVVLRPGP